MQPVITPDESARLDAAAADPVEVLMDRAGFAVAVAAAQMGAGYGTRVLVLCGPGNNGGDGYVAARHLAGRGADVEIRSAGDPKDNGSPAQEAAAAAADVGVPALPLGDPESADLVVDALFGAGFRGALSRQQAAWTETTNPVLAVDLPSGLDGLTGVADGACFTAERTVTFHALKTGHVLGEGPDRSGKVEVVDIGLEGGEPHLRLCEQVDAPRPARSRTAHKWSAGSVIVVGGSPGIAGAAMLSAQSVLHFGAGAVTLACPAVLQPSYAAMAPDVMTLAVGEGDRFDASVATALLETAERFDVMLVGPGLGPDQDRFVASLLEGRSGPLVLDADGLNAVVDVDLLTARSGPTIITPHHGEFARLTGASASLDAAQALASASGVVVLLKGGPTLVVGEESWAVTTGGPELATIGTGDVLGGMVSALWARGLGPEASARSAAYWHGIAGAGTAKGTALTAGGLARAIGRWAW